MSFQGMNIFYVLHYVCTYMDKYLFLKTLLYLELIAVEIPPDYMLKVRTEICKHKQTFVQN